MIADSINVKLSGLIKACLVAKKDPANAAANLATMKNIVGDKGLLLTENLEVTVSFYNERPISIGLPNQIKSKIFNIQKRLSNQQSR